MKATFRNYYLCPQCGNEWTGDWDCTPDDDCLACGERYISPYQSADLIAVLPNPDPDQSAPDQNDIAQRVHEFGHAVLWIMEEDEEWGADTLESIQDCAHILRLGRTTVNNGMFRRTPEVIPDARQYEGD